VNLIDKHIKWIMLVSGALTCSMVLTVIAPQMALNMMFGATLDGPLAQIMVRSWGVLVTMTGALLIYGAHQPGSRSLALILATVSKIGFVGLIFVYGQAFLAKASLTIIIDLAMAALFVLYLLGSRPAR